MHELVKLISKNVGLTTEQSTKALNIVSDFVKEQFPLMSSTVDSVLDTKNSEDTFDQIDREQWN